MTLFSTSLVTVLGLAIVGTILLWCRKKSAADRPQHPGEAITSLIGLSRARPLMEMEMERARRLGYTLAIIAMDGLVPVKTRTTVENDCADILHQKGKDGGIDNLLRSTKLLQETLRMIDIPAYDEHNNLVLIMLPGSDNTHAAQTANRIKTEFQEKFDKGVLTGCADFPVDGLLLDDLIACAASRIGQPENVVRIHGRAHSNAT